MMALELISPDEPVRCPRGCFYYEKQEDRMESKTFGS
jgi:hypothetical protein